MKEAFRKSQKEDNDPRYDLGYFSPENKTKAVTHNLFFNPGWPQDKQS